MDSIIDSLFALSLFLNALFFLPQALKIYKNKNANDISLITFLGFNLMQLLSVLHGFLHRDYILVTGFFLSFITCSFVTFLAFYYRNA